MCPFLLALAACIAYHAFAAWGWWGVTGRRSWIAAGCHSAPLPHQRTRHAHTVGELLLLPALATTCPPLVSFMIYFCLWHSVRHILCVSSTTFDALRWQRALLNFALHALPFSLATLALAGPSLFLSALSLDVCARVPLCLCVCVCTLTCSLPGAGLVWHRNTKPPLSYMPPAPSAVASSPAISSDSSDWSADLPALAQVCPREQQQQQQQ